MKFNLNQIKKAYTQIHGKALWKDLEAALMQHKSAKDVVSGENVRRFERVFNPSDGIKYIEFDVINNQAYNVKLDGTSKKTEDTLSYCLECVDLGVWREIT